MTCDEASKKTGISIRRLQQQCKNNEIKGALKKGKIWDIPDFFINEKLTSQRLPLPIGTTSFIDAVLNYYYVDKTLLIKDVIDTNAKVTLFTRPRRFGKTLTLDMLKVFFEKSKEDTSIYFKNKKIFNNEEKYKKYQGKYPTIFISFKDVKCETWQETLEKIKKLISIEFRRHEELEHSNNLSRYDINQYQKYASEDVSSIDLENGLQILSLFLYKHYAKECVIIIDEYDTPILQGYNKGFYNEVISFMRNFFSGGLKDNNYLAFGFLSGILKVAKESIFSGLNNISINSILDNEYSQYFGFTKDEVKDLLKYYNASEKNDEVIKWYDGYKFGDNEIFNPWSLINYIAKKCIPKAYWQATGSNDIIGNIISSADLQTIINLEKLMKNEKITSFIDTDIVYLDIDTNPYSIYSFLLLTGYLKVCKIYPQNDGNYLCDLKIPNKEIALIYEKEVLLKNGRVNLAIEIKQAIFSKDIKTLQKTLEKFLLDSISYFDVVSESFYHGMMLGLCAIVSNEYEIKSNLESGFGRFDILLYPLNKANPAFIFELKNVKDEKELEKSANLALKQIDEKAYDLILKKENIQNIIKVGIAFSNKKTFVVDNLGK